MASIRAMLACLMIGLMVKISLSSVHGSSHKKRNTYEIRVQSQETDGVGHRERNPVNNEDEGAYEEENDSAEGDRNVRNRAQNVLQVFLEIHNYNARNKKSNSKKFNEGSSEQFVYESGRGKKNGKEKQEVYLGK